jgi:hypothetical protein
MYAPGNTCSTKALIRPHVVAGTSEVDVPAKGSLVGNSTNYGYQSC